MSAISDSFAGTGPLENHLSDQGKPWVEMAGSLSLDGSGLTTDAAGIGEYYLDDPAFGVASPPQIDLNLNLPNIPSPVDEAMDFWLFACGNPVNSDFTNTLALNLIYRSVGHWSWEADAADPLDNFDFATGALAGPPSVISINPATKEFLIDGVVVAGPLSVTPVWDANSRPVIKMSFVTGVNVHATSMASSGGGGGNQNSQSNEGRNSGLIITPEQRVSVGPVTARELRRGVPLMGGRKSGR